MQLWQAGIAHADLCEASKKNLGSWLEHDFQNVLDFNQDGSEWIGLHLAHKGMLSVPYCLSLLAISSSPRSK